MREWNFVTTHAQALLLVAKQPSITIGQIVISMGTTRYTASKLMADFVANRYVSKSRVGREFRYQINPNIRLSDENRRELEVCDYLYSLFIRKKSKQRDC